MMSDQESSEAASRILDVLKKGNAVLTLRDLAKRSGFQQASQREFKAGLNYLLRIKAIKLRQSGWRSEYRGSNMHPKSVVLISDIYEAEKVEESLAQENTKYLDLEEPSPQADDFTLVRITTICGNPSYISKSAYREEKKEKHGFNCWMRY